jgi:hypothetical protein
MHIGCDVYGSTLYLVKSELGDERRVQKIMLSYSTLPILNTGIHIYPTIPYVKFTI